MTANDIIYDILEIRKSLGFDSDTEELWLFYKVNSYRAIFIQSEFALTNSINNVWLQRIRRFKTTKCTAADDPVIILSSITLSKGDIPKVVSLPDDLGMYRLSGSGAIKQYEPCDFNTLMMKIEIGEDLNGYGFYSKIGTDVYVYPLAMELSAIIIAEDPSQVDVFDKTIGELRSWTLNDEYPVDIAIAQKIVLEILTKDFAILDKAIIEVLKDPNMKLRMMKNAASPNEGE